MSHGDGSGFTRNGVWMAARWNENRAFHKFMQIGAANATPSHLHAHGAWGNHWFWNVFNADVASVVKTGCFHVCSFMM